MKREQILMVSVLALVALLSWRLLTRETTGVGPRSARSLALELAALGPEEPTVGLAVDGDRRDAFVQPQDDFPLEPLSLPAPPLAALPDLLPPPIPDGGPNQWSTNLYRTVAAPQGDLDDLIDSSVEGGLGDGLDENESTAPVEQDPDADFSASYDSIKIDAIRTIYGWILNEDRYEKEVGDTIRFQEVRPETGEERFAPREFAGDEYENFAFAETLRNEIELRVREMRQATVGRTVELRGFIDWLLESGMQEPIAFGYAEELARQLIRLAKDDVQNWLTLGRVWERTFRFDEAFTLYARLAGEELPASAPDLGLAIEAGRFPTTAALRVGMARVLRRIGVDADAEALLRRAEQLQPGDADTLYALGDLLLAEGRAAEALGPLERVDGMPLQRTSALALQAGNALGRAYAAVGRFADAEKTFGETARAAGSNALGAPARQGQIAAVYLAGEFAQAGRLVEDALEQDGALPELLYLRALAALADEGAAAEIVRDLRAAAEAAPLDAAPALAALAFTYDLLEMRTEADEALARSLGLDPDLPYARFLEARWAARDGQLEEASTTLRSLVAASPRCAAALIELGWLLHQQGAYEAAEVAYRRAELARPSQPAEPEAWADLALRRGLTQIELDDWERAGELLRDALALQPMLYAAQNALALVAYAEGDLTQAVADFGYLLDTLRDQPEHPQAVFARTWQERIQRHAELRLWLDPFDGNRLRPGWDVQTKSRVGVAPELRDGKLAIQGNHSGAGETRASREVVALHFQSFSGELEVGEGHRGDAGVFLAIETRQGRQTWSFEVFRDREGQLVYQWKQSAREDRQLIGRRLPAGVPERISFELDREPSTPVLTVRVGDQVVYEEPAPVLKSAAGSLVYGLIVTTSNALPVDATLDDVSVIYAKP